jgi:arylsulfatase A-like enzyme
MFCWRYCVRDMLTALLLIDTQQHCVRYFITERDGRTLLTPCSGPGCFLHSLFKHNVALRPDCTEMLFRRVVAAVVVAIVSYVVVRFELWDKKWLVIAPMYFRKHVILRLTNPIHPNTPVNWKPPSRRQVLLEPRAGSAVPNIILIISDDLGINDLSGGCGVQTPNIDSIRHNGVAFAQAYAGQATCAPSRGAMLTGRYPTRFGYEFTPGPKGLARILTVPTPGELFPPILHKELIKVLPPVENMSLTRDETLISEVLQQQGYDTYYIGKWDAGAKPPHTPVDRGYNESLAFHVGASLYMYEGHPDLVNGYGDKFDDFLRLACRFTVNHNNGHVMQPDKYMTDYLSEQASNMIKSRAAGGEVTGSEAPFFLTLAYNAPHNPYQAMRADFEDPEVQKLPTVLEQVYAAMVKSLDRGVGTVLQALKDSNQYDNTIVIFTNDNGGAHYANLPNLNRPYRGWKATFFEGGIRVPMFMQWPARIQPLREAPASEEDAEICRTYANRSVHLGVRCGYRVVDDVVSHVDLFTSLVSLTHPDPAATSAHRLDGLNFFDLIKAQDGWISHSGDAADSSVDHTARSDKALEQSRTRVLYWRSGHYSAIRVGDWKLQMALRPDKVWLYDLRSDPTERRNLAEEVGVTNRPSLETLSVRHAAGDVAATGEHASIVERLLRVFAAFEAVEAEQAPASWPAASETPITVDKVIGAKQEPDDECIYWSN